MDQNRELFFCFVIFITFCCIFISFSKMVLISVRTKLDLQQNYPDGKYRIDIDIKTIWKSHLRL
jgi:hypothetical protein